MIYKLRLSTNAQLDLERHKKSGNKKLLIKITDLLIELKNHPRTGTGQPELLKHDLQGLYSRRISKKHRIIYDVQDEIVTVLVLSLYDHYGDK